MDILDENAANANILESNVEQAKRFASGLDLLGEGAGLGDLGG